MADIREIVHRLGGEVSHSATRAALPGPGHSKKDRSLTLELAQGQGGLPDRILYFCHCGCGHGHRQVMDYLGLSSDQAGKQRPTDRMRNKHDRSDQKDIDTAGKLAFCRQVWSETRPLQNTIAMKYLGSRAIVLGSPPAVLRFHPKCPWGYPQERMRYKPAMIALVQNRRGDAIGVHATGLAPDGSVHDGRLMFGGIAGGAVRLADPTDELAIAEGIETAFSYMDLQARPCWALLSTSQFKAFVPPRGVQRLYAAADMDDKLGTSIALCRSLVGKFQETQVVVDAPPQGTDWNSYARRMAAQGAQ